MTGDDELHLHENQTLVMIVISCVAIIRKRCLKYEMSIQQKVLSTDSKNIFALSLTETMEEEHFLSLFMVDFITSNFLLNSQKFRGLCHISRFLEMCKNFVVCCVFQIDFQIYQLSTSIYQLSLRNLYHWCRMTLHMYFM